MTSPPPCSLRHEYDVYVEREIESYKESVSRSVLLAIGDDAVASLRAKEQIELDEMVLWEEVDRIIKVRLAIPKYQTWRGRRLRMLKKFRTPEHWGIAPTGALVRAIRPTADKRVLVAGTEARRAALYLAANGCDVTALEHEEDAVDRVMSAAATVGLTRRVHGQVCDLGTWSPHLPLDAVVCTPGAFNGLCAAERERVITLLQRTTASGGVHLLEALLPTQEVVTIEELASRYVGWDVSVERTAESVGTFLARKGMS